MKMTSRELGWRAPGLLLEAWHDATPQPQSRTRSDGEYQQLSVVRYGCCSLQCSQRAHGSQCLVAASRCMVRLITVPAPPA
jgi:hypothetical protein